MLIPGARGVVVVVVDSSTRWAAAIGAVGEVAVLVEQVAVAGDGVRAAAWLAELQGAVRRLDAARVRLVGVVERRDKPAWRKEGRIPTSKE